MDLLENSIEVCQRLHAVIEFQLVIGLSQLNGLIGELLHSLIEPLSGRAKKALSEYVQ
jgi:hypothetical protein